MANYKYIAWDPAGKRRQGICQANSESEVLSWLKDRNLTAVAVSGAGEGQAKKRKKIQVRSVKSADLASFCWQLSTMIEGGVPITEAIETIADDMEHRYFRYILEQITDRIRQGESISDVIKSYPKVFGVLCSSMILAGETGGTLSKTLQRLAVYYDNRDKLKRKVRAALAYPLFVVIFVFIIIGIMMVLVIPRFKMLFKMLKGELPAFTRLFMGGYEWLVFHMPLLIVIICVLIALFVLYYKTKKGHRRISQFVLKIPIIGKLLSMAFLAVFFRTLSTLLEGGVPILEALQILSKMSANDVIIDSIKGARENIVEGTNISAGLGKSVLFPNLAVKMTQVGEESGSLPEVAEKIAQHYEKKVDDTVTFLTTIMEPLLIIMVGGIVLVTVLALYLPIFTMSDVK
ncbi:MAG: type II secretion system F family protein [Planctomycetota bacterium]